MKEGYILKEIYSFDDSMKRVYTDLSRFITTKCEGDEVLIVIGEAFGQRAVVKKHSKFYGVIEMVAEELRATVMYITDSTARAEVLGKGQGRNKAAVHEKYGEETADLSDCCLFIDYVLKVFKE